VWHLKSQAQSPAQSQAQSHVQSQIHIQDLEKNALQKHFNAHLERL
jgi:hypothetical protein